MGCQSERLETRHENGRPYAVVTISDNRTLPQTHLPKGTVSAEAVGTILPVGPEAENTPSTPRQNRRVLLSGDGFSLKEATSKCRPATDFCRSARCVDAFRLHEISSVN